MTKADCVLSTPPLNTSSIQETTPPPEARADSVDSFSPQPAIGQPESANRTGESCKPASGLSRRNMLGTLAGLAILPGALPAAEPDPVFAAIGHFRQLSVEYTATVERSGSLHPEDPDYREAMDNSSDACDALFEQMDVIFTFRPVTVAGAAALLRYISNLEEWQMPPGIEDGDGKVAVQTFCVSLAAALEAIDSRKAVQS